MDLGTSTITFPIRPPGTLPVKRCLAACEGNDLADKACRPGYACFDPTPSLTTDQSNFCAPNCTRDQECAGAGEVFGCNPWSKACDFKDNDKRKYGAACTLDDQCETGRCASWPGGYCAGWSRKVTSGTLGQCALGGVAAGPLGMVFPGRADNFEYCYQGCEPTDAGRYCRLDAGHACRPIPGSSAHVCRCGLNGESCSTGGDCCNGVCNEIFKTCG